MLEQPDPHLILDAEQVKLLTWIRDNAHHRARWLVDGRPPIADPPETWTHIELAGWSLSVTVSAEAWHKSRNMITERCDGGRIYALSGLGHAALTDNALGRR